MATPESPAPPRWKVAVRLAVGTSIALAVVAVVAIHSGRPMVVPSLGPTALMAFAAPNAPAAHPRRTIVGHLVGLAAGLAAEWGTGLWHAPSAFAAGMDARHAVAVVCALVLTGVVTLLLDVFHPPAGATTLLVALGVLSGLEDMLAVAGGVVLLTVLSVAINAAFDRLS